MTRDCCIALVPARDFRKGKSRLAPLLGEAERRRLGRWMLGRVLEALRGAGAVDEVAVLSDGREVLAFAGERGAAGIACAARDINADLEAGRAWALGRGAGELVVVPADLPTLTREDVAALLARGREAAGPEGGAVVLAPAPDGGTNGLYCRPADALPFAFGEGSFPRHRARAEARGLRALALERAGFGLDIDRPADLAALAESGAALPAWLPAIAHP